jgi:predicted SAM-dependent methyltransferase
MLSNFIRKGGKYVYGRVMQTGQIAEYLREVERPRLNVGCGHNVLDGWLNADLQGGRGGTVFMDASRRWPIHENSFDAILCEHTIEHVPKEAAVHLLAEAFRVLRPGGQIRVVTPDLGAMAKLILDPSQSEHRQYLRFVARFHQKSEISSCDALNYLFYCYGHKYIYTVEELAQHLRSAGFDNVVETRAGHPVHVVFIGAEGHPNFMGLENDSLEAFALEAIKPSSGES